MFHYNLFGTPKILTKKYIQSVGKALEEATKKPQKWIINIITVSPDEIAFLNKSYREKDGPTDILTFSYLHDVRTGKDIAGEIYLCLEKIKFYAEERWITYLEQLEYIIVHGLVHMMGYDHETEKGSKEMGKIEKKVTVLLKEGK